MIKAGSKVLVWSTLKATEALAEVLEVYTCVDSTMNNTGKNMLLIKRLDDPRMQSYVISEDDIVATVVYKQTEAPPVEIPPADIEGVPSLPPTQDEETDEEEYFNILGVRRKAPAKAKIMNK